MKCVITRRDSASSLSSSSKPLSLAQQSTSPGLEPALLAVIRLPGDPPAAAALLGVTPTSRGGGLLTAPNAVGSSLSFLARHSSSSCALGVRPSSGATMAARIVKMK